MKRSRRLPLWRLCLALLFAFGFLVFLAPVFGGILDLSNASAMAAFLLLTAAALWPDFFLRLLRRLWRRPWTRVLLLVSGVGLGAVLILLLVLMVPVIRHMKDRPAEDCPTLVVLGCQVRREDPSLLLGRRINAAESWLREHPKAAAILSGGQGPGEDISEAECMYRTLTARGIDPARLFREDRSHNTKENLQFSRAMMEEEGLSGPALLISNDFHIYRARLMARDQDFPVQALAAESAWYSVPTYVFREAMALVKYFLS